MHAEHGLCATGSGSGTVGHQWKISSSTPSRGKMPHRVIQCWLQLSLAFATCCTCMQVTYQVRICFDASGISITEKGAVTQHGALLGWSSAAGLFGFANGLQCTTGPLFNRVTYRRASAVRLGCCASTAVYLTALGEWHLPRRSPPSQALRCLLIWAR